MFWRMTGLPSTSPVDSILDKENYTIEELLDEDEIIQECKALNTRLVNFLRERTRVEQLLRYIVDEAPDDAEEKRAFKFPFIVCEIFTCEIDIILKTLVEDEELMNLLFSFLKPDRSHSTLLAGYFSKVVICLMLRKTVPLMNYIRDHLEIFQQLVDLIGITSIMEVLIRLIGADEHVYSNCMDTMQWLEEANVLEMIVDKFSSSDSPEVHANAAEVLCAITRYSPPVIAAKITSPSFVGRLFCHALGVSRPKSVLIHSLTICISLLDPKRVVPTFYHSFRSHMAHESSMPANAEMINEMLANIGDLLKLLEISSSENILPTAYGTLQPPLGAHRLKIVEFISVLLMAGSETAEEHLIHLGAIQRIFDLFFLYPYNNFLHHHVETIIIMCLESKSTSLVEHVLQDCNIVRKILNAEKHFMLSREPDKLTLPVEGRSPPRIGNLGHLTRIANKLTQLGKTNNMIQIHLQDSSDWINWHTDVLLKRNVVEDVHKWTCGRPTSLQDRNRDSDDEDFRERDYDVAALANNLSQAFRYGIYNNDNVEEDIYFDDESAEVVISSLRLGDDQDSGSLFTNSDWFAFEDERAIDEIPNVSPASSSPSSDQINEVDTGKDDHLTDRAMLPQVTEPGTCSKNPGTKLSENGPTSESEDGSRHVSLTERENSPEWVEWRETSDIGNGNPDRELSTSDDVNQTGAGASTVEEASVDVLKNKGLLANQDETDKDEESEATKRLHSSVVADDPSFAGQKLVDPPQSDYLNPSVGESPESIAPDSALDVVEP